MTYIKSGSKLIWPFDMDDPHDFDLVSLAFRLASNASGQVTSGYVEWKNPETEARVRAAISDLHGLTSSGIRRDAVNHVRAGGKLVQVIENRQEHKRYSHYYRIVLPYPDIPRGVFVEFVLLDNDPDNPQVLIVNAHQQGV